MGSVAAAPSDLDNKVFKSSSRVSAPVFFVLGEPTDRVVPSLKAAVVLILSAYVENLRGWDKDDIFGESPVMAFLRDGDVELVETC